MEARSYTQLICVLLLLHINRCNRNVQNEYYLIYALGLTSLTVENMRRYFCNDWSRQNFSLMFMDLSGSNLGFVPHAEQP